MVFRAKEDRRRVSKKTDKPERERERESVGCSHPPSSVRVWLEETPSVSVTTTEYLPRSSLSGLVNVSLDLRDQQKNR